MVALLVLLVADAAGGFADVLEISVLVATTALVDDLSSVVFSAFGLRSFLAGFGGAGGGVLRLRSSGMLSRQIYDGRRRLQMILMRYGTGIAMLHDERRVQNTAPNSDGLAIMKCPIITMKVTATTNGKQHSTTRRS